MNKTLKSPLKWYGGKTRLVKKLLPLIPEHKTYVEGFAGSAALLFAKRTSDVEVINDIDSGLVNFYRVLRDPEKHQRLLLLLELSPYSREDFAYCKMTWATCEDDVEKARRWFVTMRQSFGAIGSAFSVSVSESRKGKVKNLSAYLSAVERLPEIHERLRGVQIEHKDFRELIETYDRPGTFFYLDPPYVLSTRSGKVYAHEMNDEDHRDLVNLMLGVKGKVMLSGYANPLYEPLEDDGWGRHDFKATSCFTPSDREDRTQAGIQQVPKGRDRTESVWIRR